MQRLIDASEDTLARFQSWWKNTLALLYLYFELQAKGRYPDQDSFAMWEEFVAYMRSFHMTGDVYQRFRDGSDMDRADILDAFLKEKYGTPTDPPIAH